MARAFQLLVFLLHLHRLHPAHAMALYADAIEVVAESDPLYDGPFGRLRTLLIVIEWAARESGGDKAATGKDGDCGRLQLLYPPARKGYDCKTIRAAKDLDLRLGLAWMRDMRDACGGSVRKGLAAYARGACTSPEGLTIADARLSEILKAQGAFP
jgi:hypothetical protein